MEMTNDVQATSVTRSRSWLLALVLGAVLTMAGAASVFAGTESATPSASPSATSEDSGGATDDSGTTTDHDCPDRSDETDSSTDSSS